MIFNNTRSALSALMNKSNLMSFEHQETVWCIAVDNASSDVVSICCVSALDWHFLLQIVQIASWDLRYR